MNETLLGVPKATLLRAMEICKVEWEGAHLSYEQGAWNVCQTGGTLLYELLPESLAAAAIKDAFRGWLVGEGCDIRMNATCTLVTRLVAVGDTDAASEVLAMDPHHLTAQALAVVEIGGECNGTS